jgi:hypothetical protein
MRRNLSTTHERLTLEERVTGPSNRSVGLVFSVVFAIVGLGPMVRGNSPRWWAVSTAAALLAVTFLFPRVLTPLNRAWLTLGLALHAVVSPLVMGLLFYTTMTPIGLLLRLLGKDLLRLRLDPAATTYWIDRAPPGPAPDTMRRQF